MTKMSQAQARAVSGGGFFSSLFKFLTGSAVLGDPVVGGSLVAGDTVRASFKHSCY